MTTTVLKAPLSSNQPTVQNICTIFFGHIQSGKFTFRFTVNPHSDSIKPSILFVNVKPNSGPVIPAWIQFHWQNGMMWRQQQSVHASSIQNRDKIIHENDQWQWIMQTNITLLMFNRNVQNNTDNKHKQTTVTSSTISMLFVYWYRQFDLANKSETRFTVNLNPDMSNQTRPLWPASMWT